MPFRQKATMVDAWRFDAHPQWLRNAIMDGKIYYQGGDQPYYTIETPEGKERVNPGDWIVCEAAGDIRACPHDTFDSTYERIPTPPSQNGKTGP
jgi:hypothetical protein